ncbi:MAG: hypothetical protein IPK50_14475 [Fibrobacterota bacterium]|nr:hypothetical protein [Fibrobacterota bacterium]QQS03502.1 MAG: hypothetical protein IPK50_14475 [Fibrobacterota bacterium]
MLRILLPIALAAASQAQIVTFSPGSLAKAAEVNGNFAYLSSRLDSLAKALSAKDSAIARLNESTGLSDSLKGVGKRLDTGIPKGTIAAFLTRPGTDGFLPNSDQTWVIAAGQGEMNEVKIPDLRGQFLRGIDQPVTGAKDTIYAPGGRRDAGTFQPDAFQGHWHNAIGSGSPKSGQGGIGGMEPATFPLQPGSITEPVPDKTNGTPRTASETRPMNVAVHWYIKVK